MNERIRELAEHCDFYVGNEHYNESHEEKQRLWVEKFAELIVRECVRLARDTDLEDVEGGDSSVLLAAKHHILDYFGVEE